MLIWGEYYLTKCGCCNSLYKVLTLWFYFNPASRPVKENTLNLIYLICTVLAYDKK